MDDEPTEYDKGLLARLNALKQSNVVLDAFGDRNLNPVTAPSEIDESPEDLIARFQKIHNTRSTEAPRPDLEEASYGHGSPPQSPTIEELLAQIGGDEQCKLNPSELKESQNLLVKAKAALPTGDHANSGTGSMESRKEQGDMTDRPPTTDAGQSEEVEAEAALQRILGEVENELPGIQESSGARPTAATSATGPTNTFASLQFPTTPDSIFDSLNLPSAPSTAPIARQISARPKSQGASEQEIESWCIICCADASVQCFGCDKDLYCWGCWREGHMGESAGLEERQHVWERYTKPRTRPFA